MAVVYFTGNASTGAGSLAEAVKNAQPGDVVRPDETVFERGSTIEIVLASTFTVDKNLTLDASPFRVRLNGGGAIRCATVAANVTAAFVGVDFVGGCNSGVGGGINAPGTTDVTFERCGFYGCAGVLGGGAYTTGTTRYFDCVFSGCLATESGGGIYISKTAELNGVTIAGCVAATKGDSLHIVNGTATAVNSIICGSVGNPQFLTATGSVVDVASSAVGFVASPPDDLSVETWTANAWQDWDLRLLDDASSSPSPYRDSGDVGKTSRYDVQGNIRGRETNGVATCSPGAYETIQADLFWVGEPFPQEMVDAAPQNIRVFDYVASSNGSFSATMAWELPAEFSYVRLYGEYFANGVWRSLSGVREVTTSRTATALSPGGWNTVRIRGVFADGSYTAWSVIRFQTPQTLDGSDGEQHWEIQLPSPLNVVGPSFLKSDGWATSRFATEFSDVAPQDGQTLFVDGAVSFVDAPSTNETTETNLTVGGASNVAIDAASPVYLRALLIGLGASYNLSTIPISICRVGAWARLGKRLLSSIACEFDANSYLATGYFYNAKISPVPVYGTLNVAPSTTKRIRLDGVYTCKKFGMTGEGSAPTRNVKIGESATIRATRVSFETNAAPFEELFDKQVTFELQGVATVEVSDAAPTSWRDAFAVDVSNATEATLTLNGQTVYGDAPTTAVALTGSAKVDERGLVSQALTINADATLNVDGGRVCVESLTVVDGASVALSSERADAVLTATESATVGAATFAGVGYFATPPGTDLTAGTFAETVRRVDVGAGVETFAATATGPKTARLEWSATDAGATVCVERENAAAANGWEVIAITPTETASPLEVALSGRERFRIFDGATFSVDSAWFPTSAFYVYVAQAEAFETRGASRWEIIVQTMEAGPMGYRNEGRLFKARIRDALNDRYLTPGDVESITATLYKVTKLWNGPSEWTPVSGRENFAIDVASVLEKPTLVDGWTLDEIGPNVLIQTPPDMFPEGGEYRLQATFRLTDGRDPVVATFEVKVK